MRCRCERRLPEEYAQYSTRSRFAFLYNGYATDRSGVVVAWEALVMLRKLAVTLAGSVLQDSYLQIIAALLILVVSCLATALVQPYETLWLTLLDTAGLFTLILTQILSISYLYVGSAVDIAIDPQTLEVIVTSLLFAVNAAMLVTFVALYISEMAGLRGKCNQKKSTLYKVAAAAQARAALRGAGAAPVVKGQRWYHPSGIAVVSAPKRGAEGVWIWICADVPLAISDGEPQLLLPVASMDELDVGAAFRWVRKTSHVASKEMTKPQHVGGIELVDWVLVTDSSRARDAAAAKGTAGAPRKAPAVSMQVNPLPQRQKQRPPRKARAVSMQDNPLRRETRAETVIDVNSAVRLEEGNAAKSTEPPPRVASLSSAEIRLRITLDQAETARTMHADMERQVSDETSSRHLGVLARLETRNKKVARAQLSVERLEEVDGEGDKDAGEREDALDVLHGAFRYSV